jgi:PAS domain S-box-containing protein
MKMEVAGYVEKTFVNGEATGPEPRFRALAMSAPVGIYELDRSGGCVFVNEHWCELAGVEAAEALGRGWEDVIHPEDLPTLIAEWTAASERGEEFALEYRYLRPSGEVVWVAGRAIAMRDEAGEVLAYLGTVVDITDNKLAQRRLAESSRHFELSHDLIATCGLDGRFKQLNGAWEPTLGWSPSELLPNPFVDIVHPDDRGAFTVELASLARGESTSQLRIRVAAKDGGWRWTEWSAMPEAEGGLFYASGRDITERVEAQLDRERERRQLADAQEIASIGSFTIELATGARSWSAQQFRNLGFDPGGPVPSAAEISARIHPDDRERFESELAGIAADGHDSAFEYRVVAADGEPRTIAAQARLVVDPKGARRIMGVTRDVTAERDADRLKEEFFGLVSHELRTPLTSIIGYTELLAEIEAENLSEQGRRFLEVIERNSRRELSLVGDLLLLTRVTAGTFEIEVGRADIGEIAAATVEAARPAAEKAGIELLLDAPAGLVAEGDPHRLRQVLENLVSNAIKFTPDGGRVEVEAKPEGAGIGFRVTDTGIGIAATDLGHLFDRMYRAQEAERRHIQGTGLGLTIVKAIVDAHEAAIAVASEPGEGTTFRVTLPRRARDAEPARRQGRESADAPTPHRIAGHG